MPPPSKRRYHHGDLKRALVQQSLLLVKERGEDFALREVAAAVGVSHAAAYRHFDSKAALLAAIAQDGFERLDARIAAAVDDATTPRSVVEAILVEYLRFAWNQPEQFDVMFGPRRNRDGRFPDLEAAVQSVYARVQAALRPLVPGRRERAARDAAIGLWTWAHGFTVLALRKRIKLGSRRDAESYLRLIARPLIDSLCGS